MEQEIYSALNAIMQLYIIKLQKIEDEIKILLLLYELEESNIKYNETVVRLLLLQDFSASQHKEKDSTKNVYVPKYEWTEERTKRLLDSVQRHYLELVKNKDYSKPIWENIRTEVDYLDGNLKWYTCRHKWSHIESDYCNYIKDLQEYTGRKSSSQLSVYVPHHFELIGNILRSAGNHTFALDHQGSSLFLQKMLEDRIGEALKTSTWNELGSRVEDEELITITDVDIM